MSASDRIVDEIERFRRSNNVRWMQILRIALHADPQKTKLVLNEINKNDRKISTLLGDLCLLTDEKSQIRSRRTSSLK